MDMDMKKEARKQYLRYFRLWFIVLGIMAVIFAVVTVGSMMGGAERKNTSAPTERVYDYAEVLTAEEEQKLRDYIAKCEARYQIDLVLVTINEDVESQGSYNSVMINKADDFYDLNNYGFNKARGNGALLLDNWYEDANGSQKGSCLSTCGIVEDRMNTYEVNQVLDAVYYKVDNSPYEAYKAYIDTTCSIVDGSSIKLPWLLVLGGPLVIALIYAFAKLNQAPAMDTTTSKTYVAGGEPVMKTRSDDFIRKHVVTKRIETNNNSGGGRSGGGGGHHVSRSGVSHGGGVRRR